MPAPKQKVAALALAGVMAFGLTACDDSDNGTDGVDITDPPVVTDAPLPEDDGSVFDDTTAPVDG